MKSITEKLLLLLSFKEKQKLFVLLFFLLFAAVIEMLGIGLLIPVLLIISDSESFLSNSYILILSRYLGNPDTQVFINLILLSVIFIFVVKNIILYFMRYTQYRIVYGICHTLRSRLIKLYLSQEWKFHLRINSSIILRNITHELQRVSSLIDTYVLIIAESLVIVSILLIILLYTPIESIVMVLFMIMIVFILSKILPRKMKTFGKMRTDIDGILIQQIKEIFGAIKEVIVLGQGSNFHKYLTRISKKESILHAKLLNAQNIPHLTTETLIICVTLGIVLVFNDVDNLKNIIPVIGVIAAAGIRLKPSVSKILTSFNNLYFQEDALDIIYREFLKENTHPIFIERLNESRNFFKNKIEFNKISFSYPDSSQQTIKNISFDLKKGDTLGVIGKSGGGKTTLIDLLLGLLSPSKGTIKADSIDINSNIRRWQDNIGYVPQNIFLIDDTIRQNIALGVPKRKINEDSILKAISSAQMNDLIKSLPNGLDTVVGEYGVRFSGGQRQRIGIARAMYNNPGILIFDESTSSVDNITEKKLMKSLNSLTKEKTVIIIAHRLNVVKDCDKIIMLEDGEIVAEGSWQDLENKSKTFRSFAN